MSKLIRFLFGIVLPPVGVFLTYGVSTTLFINIALTLLGWLPGSVHGVWAIAKHYENMGPDNMDQDNMSQESTT